MIEERKILVVDIETTGFLKAGGLIVEVGIVQLDLETGIITPIYNELVKETDFNESHKNAWIFNNSDLKFDDVQQAKLLDVEKLQAIFDKLPATAFNKRFDFDFLSSHGLKINELDCPMLLMTPICKLPGRYGSYKWPKVEEAYHYLFGEGYIETHRGCDDAKHEAEIVRWLYEKQHFKVK